MNPVSIGEPFCRLCPHLRLTTYLFASENRAPNPTTSYSELLRRLLDGWIRIDVFRRGFVTEGQLKFVGDLGPEFT
jgi:hypothetical protein